MSAAKALGINTATLAFEGVAYTLSTFDIEDYAKYELFLEESGWGALKRAREYKWITDFEYKELVREWLATLATHQLSFGSPDYVKSTQSLPGMRKMLELSLAHKHGETDPKLLDRMVREAYQDVYDALLKLDESPSDDSA